MTLAVGRREQSNNIRRLESNIQPSGTLSPHTRTCAPQDVMKRGGACLGSPIQESGTSPVKSGGKNADRTRAGLIRNGRFLGVPIFMEI